MFFVIRGRIVNLYIFYNIEEDDFSITMIFYITNYKEYIFSNYNIKEDDFVLDFFLQYQRGLLIFDNIKEDDFY